MTPKIGHSIVLLLLQTNKRASNFLSNIYFVTPSRLLHIYTRAKSAKNMRTWPAIPFQKSCYTCTITYLIIFCEIVNSYFINIILTTRYGSLLREGVVYKLFVGNFANKTSQCLLDQMIRAIIIIYYYSSTIVNLLHP